MGVVEDIIKQKKFIDNYHRALVGVSYLYNSIEYLQHQLFKQYGITPQQFNVLRILRGQHPSPATVGLIKERMIDRNSDASRIVERLRKAGLLDRVICANDRRAVDVVITEKGLALLKKLDEVVYSVEEPLKSLNQQEIDEFNEFLDKIIGRWSEKEKAAAEESKP